VRSERVGGWLFARRGWLPIPLALSLLLFEPRAWGPGLVLVAAGEGLRLAAVGHIGLPSRTMGADVGPLVTSGPYAWVRNPLYLGNLLLWAGLGVIAWPAVFWVAPTLFLYYRSIVAWEEENVTAALGGPYQAYCERVPRWIPRPPDGASGGRWDAARAVRSERSTLLILAVVLGGLWIRAGAFS
jgi:protein-S-isoprenylcysteine O-methyltransferase Ste14